MYKYKVLKKWPIKRSSVREVYVTRRFHQIEQLSWLMHRSARRDFATAEAFCHFARGAINLLLYQRRHDEIIIYNDCYAIWRFAIFWGPRRSPKAQYQSSEEWVMECSSRSGRTFKKGRFPFYVLHSGSHFSYHLAEKFNLFISRPPLPVVYFNILVMHARPTNSTMNIRGGNIHNSIWRQEAKTNLPYVLNNLLAGRSTRSVMLDQLSSISAWPACSYEGYNDFLSPSQKSIGLRGIKAF